MTLKSLNKKVAFASVALLAAASFASVVNAKDTSVSDSVSNGEVAIYAQSAAGSITADGSTGVTNNQTTPQAGNSFGTNDGSQQTAGEGKTPAVMSNVTFTATKYVAPTDGSETIPKGVTDPNFTGAVQTKTTDSTGLADFTGLTDGYWLFHQVTTVNGITTVNDFIVSVNTSDGSAGVVNVYPKLDMSSSAGLSTVATTNADDNNQSSGKTPNDLTTGGSGSTVTDGGVSDQTLTNTDNNAGNSNQENGTWTAGADNKNTTTAAAGNTVNWNVNTVFDSSQTTNDTATAPDTTGTYVVTDKLPTSLVDTTNTAANIVVNVTDGTGANVGTLTAGDDYTTNVGTDGTVTVTLTSKGQLQAASLLGNKDGALNIVIPTTVKDAAVGSASDAATTSITNAYGADLSTTEPVSSTLNVGGVDFTKVDSANSATTLTGATFVLVKADNVADAQALVEANASSFNNTPTNIADLKTATTSANASFVTDGSGAIVSTTTDANGLGSFTGLNLVDTDTDTTNTSNYYAVEVVAPTGYQLPSAANGANVFAVKADTSAAAGDNTITNTKPFALPFTGGEGIGALLIVAAGAGAAAFVIRRRKNADEEVNEAK